MLSILDISYNSLTGPVPRKLFGESLTELYIDENKLSGDVGFMADLSGCKSLRYIVMNNNYFTGSFPSSMMANLSSLEIFRAFENQITGHIPNMSSSISFVDLRNNQLSGEIPQSITKMKSLRGLDLSSNNLSGIIPIHIGKLTKLFGLSLSNNKLNGLIPDSIGNLSQLQELGLSNNQFTSSIPLGLWGLENIVKLDLSRNALSGSFPEGIENLKAITLLDLSSNKLHGKIPPSLGVLSTLTNLNLSKNMLQDQVPNAIGNKLSSMKTLDLSYNSLSGTIPKSFANLSYLTSLNLSFNKLYGQIPNGGVFSNITLQSLEGNTALCGLPHLGFPLCQNDESNHRHRSGVIKFILPSVVAAIVIGACLFILIRTHVNKRSKKMPVASEEANNYMTVSYFELARATNNFDNGNLLGTGSFGKVFRGILDDGQIVAIKVLNMELERATMSFDVECRALRMARHRNLVRILTTCSNLDFKALVLPYMPNESLEEWLFPSNHRRGLGLSQRVSIMLDVAQALAYLHHEHLEAVLHCDLKPSNVLLDQDMTACVADFGIARLLLGDDTSIVSRNMHGTIGYMAPGMQYNCLQLDSNSYYLIICVASLTMSLFALLWTGITEYASTGKASRKSDVFSYGIMLLEVVTGKKPTDAMFSEELSLREWVSQAIPTRLADVVDHNILLLDEEAATSSGDVQRAGWSSSAWSCLAQILDLGLRCSCDLPEERVSMKDVAPKLARIKESLVSSR